MLNLCHNLNTFSWKMLSLSAKNFLVLYLFLIYIKMWTPSRKLAKKQSVHRAYSYSTRLRSIERTVSLKTACDGQTVSKYQSPWLNIDTSLELLLFSQNCFSCNFKWACENINWNQDASPSITPGIKTYIAGITHH